MTQLHLQAHPFYEAANLDPITVEMPDGLSVAEMLDQICPAGERSDSLLVAVKRGRRGHQVPSELWGRVRPRKGSEIYVTRMPEGSGTVRSIAMLAVAAFATWITAGGFAFTTAGGTTMFGAYSASAAVLSAGSTMLLGGLAAPAMFPGETE